MVRIVKTLITFGFRPLIFQLSRIADTLDRLLILQARSINGMISFETSDEDNSGVLYTDDEKEAIEEIRSQLQASGYRGGDDFASAGR